MRATPLGIRTLSPARRTVYRLAPDLLLVFKPRGHHEAAHAHPHRQRLQVLLGTLVVQIGKRRVTLTQTSRRLTLRAGRAHTTRALRDTWLLAESLYPRA